jgi:hypothetical protein
VQFEMSDSAKPASMADRVTRPGLDASSSTFTPGSAPAQSTSWADEVASPVAGPSGSKEDPMASIVGDTQVDGQVEPLGGSGGSYINDVQYEVEVTLTLEELQRQEGNPLHSVKSFEELGL